MMFRQLIRGQMKVSESKNLAKNARVHWQGKVADSGTVLAITWDAVTITWDDGHISTIHHGDMRDVFLRPTIGL